MSDVLNVLTAIENYLIDLPMKIILKADQIFIVNGLSDVSENLGIITAGEFRSGNRLEPGKLFSGMRMAYPPMTYSASEWNLVGVNADVLQFGVRASDGKLLAGGGAVILDASGITATAGLIAGWTINTDHLLSDGTPGIKILSTGTIETSDFVSGILGKGWRISEAGDAEFNNAVVRGELRTTVLSYQEVQAVSGTMGVFQSAGVLRATYEIPAAGDATITVKDPEYGHAALFAVDDILWIKDGTNSTWLKVKVVLDNTTYYTYGCSIESGDREIEYTAGQAIVNFGVGGEGFLLMEAIGTGAPYFSVRTHAGAPYTATTEHVRMGNLNGNWGYSSAKYGVAIGQYATDKPNIILDEDGALTINIYDGATNNPVLQFDDSGSFITNILNMTGDDAAIAIGTTPPTAKDAGTGLWLSKDGLFSLASDVYQVKIDATNGKFYAGGGKVIIDADAFYIKEGNTSSYVNKTLQFINSSDVLIGYLSSYYNSTGNVRSVGLYAHDVTNNRFSKLNLSAPTSGAALSLECDNGDDDPIYFTMDATNGAAIQVEGFGGALFTVGGDIKFEGALIKNDNTSEYTGYIFVPLTTPLTSTSWDGDSFSTTAKTVIDLSAVFGAPAGIKAVNVVVALKDSGSAAGDGRLILSANNTANIGIPFDCNGQANDSWEREFGTVPCDANGDIYYQTIATGAGTLDIVIQIHGYFI